LIVDVPESRILLRPGIVQDAAQSLTLFRSVVAEECFFVLSMEEFSRSLSDQEALLQHLFLHAQSCFWVAYDGSRMVGQISVRGGGYLRRQHVGQIEMFIHKEYRKQGLGRRLLKSAIDWCKENSILRKIELSVFADNESAISLYRYLGFIEEGRIQDSFLEVDNRLRDNVLMGLLLNGK
jgi:RimJ/RimL family protein N-acetyltransferase